MGTHVGGYTKLMANLPEGVEMRLGRHYLVHKAELDALADRVVYTSPIDAYFAYKPGTLEYRSVRFETELLDIPRFQGDAVVNYTAREAAWTRNIEHKWFELARMRRGMTRPRRNQLGVFLRMEARRRALLLREQKYGARYRQRKAIS